MITGHQYHAFEVFIYSVWGHFLGQFRCRYKALLNCTTSDVARIRSRDGRRVVVL